MNLDALNDLAEILRKFIDEVAGVDCSRDKDHIRKRLSGDLTDDLTEGDYEPYGVSKNCWFSEPARHLNHVEIIVSGFGLPSKAVLVLLLLATVLVWHNLPAQANLSVSQPQTVGLPPSGSLPR